MKILLLLSFVFLTKGNCCAQYFEGEIIYHNTFKNNNATVEQNEELNKEMGSKLEYYVKGGAYKTIGNGTDLQWLFYNNIQNKMYAKSSSSDTIFWTDASVNDDPIISKKLNKNAVTILGYICDELIYICKNETQKYYFNSKIGMDPALYTNHKNGNWDQYIKETRSIPLKTIFQIGELTMETVATEIKPMELDDKEFKLPKNAITTERKR